ncbi:MAG: DNA topoisomerase 4 subunit A [Lachnospiraceae bacterium]|nr:DNA topoisomerase 4 subunit A [Lachnospiraceae bacterium]
MSTTRDQLVQLDFAEEMKTSFRDYALSVILARALPDVRDGLKPVQRRILYAMNELGLDPKKPHRKSARIVGDTMGKYHPHGDSSIYDALVHMTEDYSLNLPLVDGHGNFGSIDGDGAAAMRYTEARLSESAIALLENLEKGLVEFMPNFDESENEPKVLPATLPNLLINGTTGIAVGMATNIPPHNAGEVIDGVIAYLDNPSITEEKLMKYIPGPDFPTGGIITNCDALPEIYRTGEGKIRVRAKTEIENGDSGRKNIVVTEIPYTIAGNKLKLVENLVSLMKDKAFEEIYDVRDESSKEGIRIVIEVKKDRDPENLLNGLLKKTCMEDTYTVNLLAVKDKQPLVFSLLGLVKEFASFQEELYTREHEYLLNKAEQRLEIVGGLLRATDIIDLIIEILRGSSSVKQAKDCLINGDITDIKFKHEESKKEAATLNFTERQADAILAMPLSKLIGLEILKLEEEKNELLGKIKEYKEILANHQKLCSVIKERLKAYKKKFSAPRKTVLSNVESVGYVEEFKVEDIYILVDRFGYTKSVDASVYGKAGEEALKEFTHIIPMKNTDRLCVFTAEGNMMQVKAEKIPRCKLKDKGQLIHNLCKVDQQDVIFYASYETLFDSMLLFTTKNGFIKLVSGIEFDTNRNLMLATKLEDGDAVVGITLLQAADILADNRKVVTITKSGYSLGFPLKEVSEMKKTGRGVKAMTLDKNDKIDFVTVLPPETETFDYKGKTVQSKKIKLRARGGKGQKAAL